MEYIFKRLFFVSKNNSASKIYKEYCLSRSHLRYRMNTIRENKTFVYNWEKKVNNLYFIIKKNYIVWFFRSEKSSLEQKWDVGKMLIIFLLGIEENLGDKKKFEILVALVIKDPNFENYHHIVPK